MLAPWLPIAFADLGTAAREGAATEPRVQAYYADAGHPEIVGDDVAWCAAFVGACLARATVANTGSLLARSYLAYGTSIAEPRDGAIAVFARGDDPALGHVGFVVGHTPDQLLILGGNQTHAVSIVSIPRTRLLALRWPPSASHTQITTADAVFDQALAHILAQEGGFSDDPYDPGGPTNLGITIADLARYQGAPQTPDLKALVRALTVTDVTPIYRTLYWQPSHAPELPAALALFHFDAAVNHGLAGAARMLQQALGVAVDGIIGPLTLRAAHACNLNSTLQAYANIRRNRYRALATFWRFGRGWLARVDATLAAAQPLITHTPPTEDHTMITTNFPEAAPDTEPKWWGHSLTIWGTVITTLSTVLPVVGPLLGIDVSADTIRQLGDGVVRTAQAVGGVIGILMTIYGRTRATQPLMRRGVVVRV